MKWAIFLLLLSMQSEAAVIVQGGMSEYKIVTPDKKSKAVGYAAKELQSFLREISGVPLPIVSESTAGDGPAFLLGPCKRNIKTGLVAEAAKLREDGVLIKSMGKDIALLGQNERGNLYSVYVLLEKYLGVRFLAWDCTVIPKSRELSLPNLDYSYASPFMYRETLYFDSFPKEIATRQRLNGPFSKCDASVGGKIDIYPYVHSFATLFPKKDYFEDHPEYYGLQGGKRVCSQYNDQLCLTNPDVLKLAIPKVLKWIEDNPQIPIFDVSQNDGGGQCECEKCTAVVNEEGTQQGPILRFVNAVADEVAKKYPDKWIETLAYSYSIKPPAITKPHSNVLIRLCHAGCYFHGFETCGLGSNYASYLDQWSKLTNRIFIWHYATNFGSYLAPNQNLLGLAKDIKYYGAHNVNGLMVQCQYQGPGGELAELRQYLSAQLLWDPNRDPMQIREEFCKGYYGKSAADVLEFLRRTDKEPDDPNVHAFANWDPKTTVKPQYLADSLQILERARTASDSRTIRNRVEKLMLPYWYMQLTNSKNYNVTEEDAKIVWKQARRVMVDNKITFINEGDANVAGWIRNMDARFIPTPKDVVFDLMQTDRAKTENCAEWRTSSVQMKGHVLRTIFQHPDGKNNADATYEITLPAQPTGKRLVLKFGTVITNKTDDGVRFAILVNGKELWTETKTTFITPEQADAQSVKNAFSDHTLDMTAYAGQTISLTLRVNALANNSYDWANWVEPRIVMAK